MTIAAAGKAGAHIAGSQFAGAPSGMGGDYNGEILLLLISTGGIIFIDHARQGEPQPGDQYAALGITGFILLFLGQFWPEIAFAFALLILISVILNSPNGIPFIASGNPSASNASNQTSNSAPESAANATAPSSGGSVFGGGTDAIHP